MSDESEENIENVIEELDIEQGTIEIPILVQRSGASSERDIVRVHIRPVLYVRAPGADSDQASHPAILNAVEEKWRLPAPEVVILSISDACDYTDFHHQHQARVLSSAQLARMNAKFSYGQLEVLEKGLHKIANNCNTTFLSTGVLNDQVSRSIGRTVSRLREERIHARSQIDFIIEHQGDVNSVLSTTAVSAIGVNGTSMMNSGMNDENTAGLQNVPDASLTHFLLYDDPITISEIRRIRAQLFCRFVYDYDFVPGPATGRQRCHSGSNASNVGPVLSTYQPGRRKAALALFTSGDVNELPILELVTFANLPVLVVEDASPLCELLANIMYNFHNGALDNELLSTWLDSELLRITPGSAPAEIDQVKQRIISIVLAASESKWFVFGKMGDLDKLDRVLVETYADAATSEKQIQNALLLMIRLNLPYLTDKLDITPYVQAPWCFALLEEALVYPGRELMIRFFLESSFPLSQFLTSERYLRLLRRARGADFFQTVILSNLLGKTSLPKDATKFLQTDLSRLFEALTGMNNVFPANALTGYVDVKSAERELIDTTEHACYFALTYWALLLKRDHLALLVCAHSTDPIPIALTAEIICRKLKTHCQDWDYYQRELHDLSHKFRDFAVNLLNKFVHDIHVDKKFPWLSNRANAEAPHRSYDVLCHNLPSCGQLTATQVAYAGRNRAFIAHECCQRWVTRMLFGSLELVTIPFGWFRVPTWTKVILSICLLLPIRVWFRFRPKGKSDDLDEIEADAEHAPQLPEIPSIAAAVDKKRNVSSDGRGVVDLPEPMFLTPNADSFTGIKRLRSRVGTVGDPSSGDAWGEEQTIIEAIQMRKLTTNFVDKDRKLTVLSYNGQVCNDDLLARINSHDTRDLQQMPSVTYEGLRSKQAFVLYGFAGDAIKFGALAMHSGATQTKLTLELLLAFFTMPITKYWLALIFRLLHITLFAFSLAQPGCGNSLLDIWVWLWSLMSWIEACVVSYVRHAEMSWRHLKNEVIDVCVTACFLVLALIFRIVATHLTDQAIGTPFVGRWIYGLYMLYLCYTSLYQFIPMSEALGPLMVRIKLMVARDLVNYLILIGVVVFSSTTVAHSIIYPDWPFNAGMLMKSFNWAARSLFISDFSGLTETDECANQWIPHESLEQLHQSNHCIYTSSYANYKCPKQTFWGYFAVLQYFVLLKMVSTPLLFALFARTAAQVDAEAEHIYRYQFYDLVNKFRLHPVLPSPFTLVFFCLQRFQPTVTSLKALALDCCCRTSKRLGALIYKNTKHPDVAIARKTGSALGHGVSTTSLDQIESIEAKDNGYFEFWKNCATELWEAKMFGDVPQSDQAESDVELCSVRTWRRDKTAECKLDSDVYCGQSVEKEDDEFDVDAVFRPMRLLLKNEKHRPWTALLPNYEPPVYSLPIEYYTDQMVPHVDRGQQWLSVKHKWRRLAFAPHTVPSIRRPWNTITHQATATGTGIIGATDDAGVTPFVVLPSGLPLNPQGRMGLKGRGCLPRFGPNHMVVMVAFAKAESETSSACWVLLSQRYYQQKPQQDGHEPDWALPISLVVNATTPLGPGGWTTSIARTGLASIIRSINCGALISDQSYAEIRRLLATDEKMYMTGKAIAPSKCLAHIAAGRLVNCPTFETDNAWLELDVWGLKVSREPHKINDPEEQWKWINTQDLNTTKLMKWERELILETVDVFEK